MDKNIKLVPLQKCWKNICVMKRPFARILLTGEILKKGRYMQVIYGKDIWYDKQRSVSNSTIDLLVSYKNKM